MSIPANLIVPSLLLFFCVVFLSGCDLCCTVKQISCCLYD
uniref:Uncharacterized protein n=1 Tax=Anguilla anguilla TaxID=7936 RepID=A0A0E9RGR4_ANGAN